MSSSMSSIDFSPLPRTSSSSSSSRPLSFAHQPQSTPPRKLSRSLSSRMRLSVQLFQERHLAEFAHLHLDDQKTEADSRRLLALEKEKLEQARKIGRAKRQTLALDSTSEMERQDDIRAGWRPLSLLAGRGSTSKSAELLVTPNRNDKEHLPLSTSEPLRPRRSNATEVVTPTDPNTPELSSPFPSDVHSPDLALITPNQAGITLGCSSPPEVPRPSKKHHSSSGDNSIQSSTYSWASSFSGETAELRTAAHYVPQSDSLVEEPPAQQEEVLDSPERTKRRRKRIVALAHTVRQLEGVGSRDVEDPNFYHILVKAWNERPGVQPREAIWTQPSTGAPPPPIPPRPTEEVYRPDQYIAPPAWLAPPSLGPPSFPIAQPSPVPSSTLEHRTPIPDEGSSEEHSLDSHASSNPFRYSYASTLHDLALEGAVQHGNKLMSDKAWLRSPLFDQGTFYDAHSPSAPFPLGAMQPAPQAPSPRVDGESPSKQSDNSAGSACIPHATVEPVRQLRKCKTDISQIRGKENMRPSVDLARESLRYGPSSVPAPAPAPGPSGTTNWGLGFLGNWLRDELADANEPEPSSSSSGSSFGSEPASGADFQLGENGQRGARQSDSHLPSIQTAVKRKREDSQEGSSKRCYNLVEIDRPPAQDLDVNGAGAGEGEGSMETIDLVLPAPLPTPEIEMIAQQTGLTREEISPLPKVDCEVAKEYQYSTPCPRLSYSIPSLTSYPHRLEYTATASLPNLRRESGVGAGVEGSREMEGFYPSSGNFSSPSQISQHRPPLHLPHLEQASSTLRPPSAALGQTEAPAECTRAEYKTPKMTLQPILPPLPPTPKYRRPTPPFPLEPFIDSLSHSRITQLQPGQDASTAQSHLPPPAEPDLYGMTEQASSRTIIQHRHQDYDPSSYQGYVESELEPVTLRDELFLAHPRVQNQPQPQTPLQLHPQPHLQVPVPEPEAACALATTSVPADLEEAHPTPYVSSQHKSSSRAPLLFFILGFICPILWFVGGWPLLRPSPPAFGPNGDGDVEAQAQDAVGVDVDVEKRTDSHGRKFAWVDHPDPMVRACRWAAIISTPTLVLAGIIAVVVVSVV